MKHRLFGRTLTTLIIGLITFLASVLPANAAGPNFTKKDHSPITDPGKAVPFSHPELNLLNPKSKLYNPDAALGPSPGPRQPASNPHFTIPSIQGKLYFGMRPNTTNVQWILAYHNYVSDLTIPSQTLLYAPTLLGPNSSPLEVVTRYYWLSGVMKRHIAVFDHNLTSESYPDGMWVFTFAPTSEYLDYQGDYETEIYRATNGYWYAFIKNFDTGYWEQLYYRLGGTNKYDPYGWDIWEAINFDNDPWPNIGRTTETKDVWMYIPGTGEREATSTYANNWSNCVGVVPYTLTWNSNYYAWSVNNSY